MKTTLLLLTLSIASITYSSESCDVLLALDKANLYAPQNDKQEAFDFVEQDHTFIFTYYNKDETCYFSVEVEKNHCEIIKDHSSSDWQCP